MPIKFLKHLLLLMSLSCCFSLLAAENSPSNCINKNTLDYPELKQAIAKLTQENQATLQTENPCSNQKYISNALKKTFGNKIITSAQGHTSFLLKNGEDSLFIEAFSYKKQNIGLIEKTIQQRTSPTLMIKSLTYYDFLSIDNKIIFFIADRTSFSKNRDLFDAIKKALSTTPDGHLKTAE